MTQEEIENELTRLDADTVDIRTNLARAAHSLAQAGVTIQKVGDSLNSERLERLAEQDTMRERQAALDARVDRLVERIDKYIAAQQNGQGN